MRGGGRGEKNVLQAASPSAHAVTIQRMSRKPMCCTDPNATSRHTHTHTHTRVRTCTPPKEQLQKKETAFRKKKAYN